MISIFVHILVENPQYSGPMIGWNIKVTLTIKIQFPVESEIIPYITALIPTSVTAKFPTRLVSVLFLWG